MVFKLYLPPPAPVFLPVAAPGAQGEAVEGRVGRGLGQGAAGVDGLRIPQHHVEGGVAQEIIFTATRDVAGSYSVDVEGLSGSFTVKAAPPPPTTPTELAPDQPFNWPLVVVGGIIAIVVALAVATFLWRRRKSST